MEDRFGKVFNEGAEFQPDGPQRDRLFDDGDTCKVGTPGCEAIHTPGHAPACMMHVMGDAATVGNTLSATDGGSARADVPGGDVGQLYDSVQMVLALSDATRLRKRRTTAMPAVARHGRSSSGSVPNATRP